ncbi:hypothetical protein JOD54_006468 [Actinokineospora baliensis]|nr:hypothetical protein [Actinokineospora baliensis]
MEYEIPNRDGKKDVIRLITNLLEPIDALAGELAVIYHERWEVESTFDEIETRMRGGSDVVLRSKHPETVRQEIWALFLTHYAVRHLMHEAAEHVGIDDDRLSFVRSFQAIRRQVSDQAAYPPNRLTAAITETISEIVERPNPPRRERSHPRAVKQARSRYKQKKPDQAGTRYDTPPRIVIRKPRTKNLATHPTKQRKDLSKRHCPRRGWGLDVARWGAATSVRRWRGARAGRWACEGGGRAAGTEGVAVGRRWGKRGSAGLGRCARSERAGSLGAGSQSHLWFQLGRDPGIGARVEPVGCRA